jgi:beta-lactamase regulating signal transducer with metallopeptidase domain
MSNLLVAGVQNTVAAFALALIVGGLMRLWRNPPVAHLLWLLVLLRFLAPPVLRVDCSVLQEAPSKHATAQFLTDVPRIAGHDAENRIGFADRPDTRLNTYVSETKRTQRDLAASLWLFWNRAGSAVLVLWLGGSVLCALVAAARILRFERLLRGTLPAPARMQRLAVELIGKLGVRRVPEIRYAACVDVPLLWCAGRRPTIVLPIRLLDLDDDQDAALILSHELAHLRRGDHWVRAVELVVWIIYWWNPLVWVTRRQIHHAEELCCDAWVRWTFPDCTKRYAKLLLETAESIGAPHVGAPLLPASPLLRSTLLKARIEMILGSQFAPCTSRKTTFLIALFALLVLPWFVGTTKREARAGSDAQAPASAVKNSDTQAAAEFPYKVKFEQGATRFLDGDRITINEIRGTADTFMPHNSYLIKGTYALASHQRATLATYLTAMDAANGTGSSQKVQSTDVNQGNGTFTLVLPISCRGWPHVSFYPAAGGSDFGGNYFGTGDSVLKRWWGSKDADRKASNVPAESGAEVRHSTNTKLDARTSSDFPCAVRFEQGATRFLNGDKITILEVRGTAGTFAPGNIYLIKGTYTLASHDRAMLAAYTTAMDAEHGIGVPLTVQSTTVDRGNGTFALYLPMSCRGWPHVSFYPADGGSDFGGNYFGTGDSVLKRWWGTKDSY